MGTSRAGGTTRSGTASRRGLAYGAVALIGLALFSAGALLTASRALAVYQDVVETGAPGLLSLRTAASTPLWVDVAPGETAHWLIEATLDDADRGALSLELRSGGDLVDTAGLTAEVVACDRDFVEEAPTPAAPGSSGPGPAHSASAASAAPASSLTEPRCAGRSQLVLPRTLLADMTTMQRGTVYPLADLERDRPRYLLVTLALPPSTGAVGDDAEAVVGLGLHAAGDDTSSDGRDSRTPSVLAATGDDLLPLGLLAAGLICFGALALWRRGRTARSRHDIPQAAWPHGAGDRP